MGPSAPIRISDVLPAGVVPVGIAGIAGLLGTKGHGECSLATVSCVYPSSSIAPYDGVTLELNVRIEPGAKSGAVEEMVAEGGGAPRAVNKQPLRIGSAGTAFGVEQFEQTPEGVGGVPDTQAGSHPFQLTTTIDLNRELEEGLARTAGGLEKDLRFYLPPGLVGNPNAVPECTTGEFAAGETGANECPPDTVIGVANTTLVVPIFSPRPLTIPVPLYNLVPQTGEPARFGFRVVGDPVLLDTSVRTGGGYGVVVAVRNISQVFDLLASQVTFWGVPGDPRHNSSRGWNCLFEGGFGNGPCEPLNESSSQPLITLPTSCTTPWAPTVTSDSWAEPWCSRPGNTLCMMSMGSRWG